MSKPRTTRYIPKGSRVEAVKVTERNVEGLADWLSTLDGVKAKSTGDGLTVKESGDTLGAGVGDFVVIGSVGVQTFAADTFADRYEEGLVMSRYHATFTTPAAVAGAAYVDFRTTAADRAKILEIGFFGTTALVNVPELRRSTTVGTASTTVVPVAGEPGDPAATLLVGTAWSVAPVGGTAGIRRAWLPANIGAGVIWVFGLGDLVVPVSSAIGIYNSQAATAGAVCTGYIVYDE